MPLSSCSNTVVADKNSILARKMGHSLTTLRPPSFQLDDSPDLFLGETPTPNNFDRMIQKMQDPLASDVLRRQILPGKLGLLAEHEPSLYARKRPAQISRSVAMDEPFNPNKFNFNRVGDKETLITVADKDETHRILVNVSPLMYGHGLLIPYSKKCLPQQLTSEPIQLAIRLLRKCMDDTKNSTFCIGFNSLGAFSSVNHLHLHILYPSQLDHEARGAPLMKGRINFPIAYSQLHQTVTNYYGGVRCTVNELNWMVPCFSFESKDDNNLQTAVAKFVRYLHNNRIPHNVLFVQEPDDSATSIRCIVIPRQHQDHFDKEKYGFNAALGEISGMLIARTKEHFDNFKEHEIVKAMGSFVACKKDVFDSILSELKEGEM